MPLRSRLLHLRPWKLPLCLCLLLRQIQRPWWLPLHRLSRPRLLSWKQRHQQRRLLLLPHLLMLLQRLRQKLPPLQRSWRWLTRPPLLLLPRFSLQWRPHRLLLLL